MPPGTELGVSGWHLVRQEDIDAFARLTIDEHPYHNDPEWARKHAPLGTTISFGFLTMSMLSHFVDQVFGQLGVAADESTQIFNFGFNRLRMPEPVPAGAEIRGRFSLAGARQRDAGGLEITLSIMVEIKGNDRPALVGDWLFVAVSAEEAAVVA